MGMVKEDMKLVGAREDDAEDRVRRRQVIGCDCGKTFFERKAILEA